MAYQPANPRGSTVRTDDDGSYIAYHKVCHNCQVELTSRNRSPCGSLKCKTCMATTAREKLRATTGWPNQMGRPRKLNPDGAISEILPVKQPSVVSAPRSERHSEAHHTVSPERQAIHSLLTKFLLYPTIAAAKENLLAGLVDYELKERFRFL